MGVIATATNKFLALVGVAAKPSPGRNVVVRETVERPVERGRYVDGEFTPHRHYLMEDQYERRLENTYMGSCAAWRRHVGLPEDDGPIRY